MKKLLSIALVLTLLFSLSACDAGKKTEEIKEEQKTEEVAKEAEETSSTDEKEAEEKNGEKLEDESASQENIDKSTEEEKGEDTMSKNPVVTISTKIGDKELKDMKLELYPEKAPNTVANFVTLAQDGYYDGLIFHRIIPNFMIQGGDPTGTGAGGPGHAIAGEFAINGFENDLSHERGVISMARSQMPDSAGSQFFIVHNDSKFLDGQYAAFGKLIEGEESLDELATVETGMQDRPTVDCVMTKITVDINGYDLPEVVKQ